MRRQCRSVVGALVSTCGVALATVRCWRGPRSGPLSAPDVREHRGRLASRYRGIPPWRLAHAARSLDAGSVILGDHRCSGLADLDRRYVAFGDPWRRGRARGRSPWSGSGGLPALASLDVGARRFESVPDLVARRRCRHCSGIGGGGPLIWIAAFHLAGARSGLFVASRRGWPCRPLRRWSGNLRLRSWSRESGESLVFGVAAASVCARWRAGSRPCSCRGVVCRCRPGGSTRPSTVISACRGDRFRVAILAVVGLRWWTARGVSLRLTAPRTLVVLHRVVALRLGSVPWIGPWRGELRGGLVCYLSPSGRPCGGERAVLFRASRAGCALALGRSLAPAWSRRVPAARGSCGRAGARGRWLSSSGGAGHVQSGA